MSVNQFNTVVQPRITWRMDLMVVVAETTAALSPSAVASYIIENTQGLHCCHYTLNNVLPVRPLHSCCCYIPHVNSRSNSLLFDTALRDRPSINKLLRAPIIQRRIENFLSASVSSSAVVFISCATFKCCNVLP